MPWGCLKPVDDPPQWPVKTFVHESTSNDGSLSIRDRWYRLMEDYMARQLTNADDKLPALSGLAQSFQHKMPSNQYLAGLWKDHLPRALLWRSGMPHEGSHAHRSISWRAPSWSFLSLDGHMSYESQRLFNGSESRPEERLADYDPTGLCVLQHHVNPAEKDLYGALSEAELLLRGKVLQVGVKTRNKQGRKNFRTSTDRWKQLEIASGLIAGAICFDVENDSIGCTQVWCLPICSDPFYSAARNPHSGDSFMDIDQEVGTVMGLALQSIDEASSTFRRVGMFRWVDRSLFDGIFISDVKLI
ncbi:hypothetical protein E8E13_010414 [Curvularia kusanoi]|uniref:Uncharacterized protein n=1 Tax=Curvularia kusanoi TaxID=90978 RepID=A0A9P4WCE8_CURKU|nr:hypothetical protein E8E13_010414 [Curvularia kusanoi]